jgi:hypothetical protein
VIAAHDRVLSGSRTLRGRLPTLHPTARSRLLRGAGFTAHLRRTSPNAWAGGCRAGQGPLPRGGFWRSMTGEKMGKPLATKRAA